MLFRQTAPGSAQLWEGTGSAPWCISLDFSFISALRWCGERRALLATAVPRGRRVPQVRSGERGDLRLFRLVEGASGFEQVSRDYAGLHGVVRLGPDGAATTAMEVPKGSRVESFSVLPDGTVVAHVADFEDLTIVHRRVVARGPSQAAVNEGWRPLPDCHAPQFGFHVLPE